MASHKQRTQPIKMGRLRKTDRIHQRSCESRTDQLPSFHWQLTTPLSVNRARTMVQPSEAEHATTRPLVVNPAGSAGSLPRASCEHHARWSGSQWRHRTARESNPLRPSQQKSRTGWSPRREHPFESASTSRICLRLIPRHRHAAPTVSPRRTANHRPASTRSSDITFPRIVGPSRPKPR